MKVTHAHIVSMLRAQDEVNNKMASKHGAPWLLLARLNQAFNPVGKPDVVVLPVNYARAAAAELMELQVETGNGFPIKWWENADAQMRAWGDDTTNRMIEYVDMMHFGMSVSLLATAGDANTLSEDHLAQTATYMHGHLSAVEELPLNTEAHVMERRAELQATMDSMLAQLLQFSHFDWALFGRMINLDGFLFDDLFNLYFGKNVLNGFRQAMQLDGATYSRTWADGVADNVHLARLVAASQINAIDDSAAFFDALNAALHTAHDQLTAA